MSKPRYRYVDGRGNEFDRQFLDAATGEPVPVDLILRALIQTYQQGGFPWVPIAEYEILMGTVLVWVSWHEYDKRISGMQECGRWEQARQLQLRGNGEHTVGHPNNRVWVYASTGVPLEVTCRVTHYCTVRRPT